MRTHLSINVQNLDESVAFYQKIFGQAPQKKAGGYAKFDLKEPLLNFSMHEAGEKRLPSRVNHLGIEVSSEDHVTTWQKRLEEIGIQTISEEDTNCCFARQDKIWFQDPDGNSWEVFFVHEQIPTTGVEPPLQPMKSKLGEKSVCGPKTGCC